MNATAQILVASPVVHLYREQTVHKIPALDGVLQLYNADNTAAVKKAVQSLKDLLPSCNDAEQHDAGRFMLDILSSHVSIVVQVNALSFKGISFDST